MPAPKEMKMYEDMLDELMSEYPELEDSALALKDELAELEMPEEEMPDSEEMPMDEEELPPMDMEELPEEDLEEEDEEEDEMAGFEKY